MLENELEGILKSALTFAYNQGKANKVYSPEEVAPRVLKALLPQQKVLEAVWKVVRKEERQRIKDTQEERFGKLAGSAISIVIEARFSEWHEFWDKELE